MVRSFPFRGRGVPAAVAMGAGRRFRVRGRSKNFDMRNTALSRQSNLYYPARRFAPQRRRGRVSPHFPRVGALGRAMALRRNRRGGFRGRNFFNIGGRPRGAVFGGRRGGGGGPPQGSNNSRLRRRPLGQQQQLSLERLDAQLEAYMGEDVVRQRLDRDLESYFASAEAAAAGTAAAGASVDPGGEATASAMEVSMEASAL